MIAFKLGFFKGRKFDLEETKLREKCILGMQHARLNTYIIGEAPADVSFTHAISSPVRQNMESGTSCVGLP
jgi:hypothetical protein